MVIGVWLTTFVSLAYYMTINFDKGFHRHRELVEIAEEDRFSKEFPIGLANFDKLKSVEKVKTVGKHKIVFQGYPYRIGIQNPRSFLLYECVDQASSF